MQILKRLILRHCGTLIIGTNKKRPPKQSRLPAQNLIEFIFIFPILIFITLIIFEVALFWQDVNSIYNLNAEINANVALLTYTGKVLGNTCPAAIDDPVNYPNSAISILKKKDSTITLSDTTYTKSIVDGSEPFALYRFSGGPNITSSNINGVIETNPQITLWVDCRNPFENGVTTQIEFYHKTIIMKASIPRFDKPQPIVIIPDNIFIASPKLNTIRHY